MKTTLNLIYSVVFLALVPSVPAFAEFPDLNGGNYFRLTGINKKKTSALERYAVCNSYAPSGARNGCGMIGTFKNVAKACEASCKGGVIEDSITEKTHPDMYEIRDTPLAASTAPKVDDFCGIYRATGYNEYPSRGVSRCALCNEMKDGRYRVPAMIGSWTVAANAFQEECADSGGVNVETITEYKAEDKVCAPIYPTTCSQCQDEE